MDVPRLSSIALVGKRGSGKSEIAKALVARFGYTRHSWADPLREFLSWAYGPVDKATYYDVTRGGIYGPHIVNVTGTRLLQWVGTEGLRAFDLDFWIKVAFRRGMPSLFVNEDTRFDNEAEAVHGIGGCVVWVSCSEETRHARLLARDGYVGDEAHASEAGIDGRLVDVVIANDDAPIDYVVDGLVDELRLWRAATPRHAQEGVEAA
jgi:hypothetical protein